MANHPNRNWRRRMAGACDAFLARWRWPSDAAASVMSTDALRSVMRESYQTGYTDGRESTKKPAAR